MTRKSTLFALAAIGTVALAGVAQAGPITYKVSPIGLTNAQNAETAFLSTLQEFTTENFENVGGFTGEKTGGLTSSVAINEQFLSISTTVGGFTSVKQGTGGACNNAHMGYSCDAGLAVLDGTKNPFSGRFNTTPTGGNNWLDSFDAMDFLFEVADGNNAVGFFITDPNDAGGRFDFFTSDGSVSLDIDDIFGKSLGSGAVFYVSFTSVLDIESIRITTGNEDPNDGFGIDGVTVGRVPEPGTLALLGLGLLGIGLMRRRG
jgi:hypothetical protein